MSTTILQPTITDAGLAAVFRATNDGVMAQISHIALGDSGYTPTQAQTKLKTEKARYPIADGARVGTHQIHMTVNADDAKAFWVKEVGIYLSDGTLLAVWSDPATALAYKSAGVELLLAYDLTLSALPPDSVTIQSTGAGLNLSVAAELAALATVQINEMARGVARDDAIAAMQSSQDIAGRLIANLQSRITAAEARQNTDRDNLLTAIAANSAAVIDLQRNFAQFNLGV